MDLNEIYGGIISPEGGIYTPQGSGIYSGILPPSEPKASASGLVTRPVNTVPVDPRTGQPKTNSTVYFPTDGSYGYNAVTGQYELRQPGNAYVMVPTPFNGSSAAAAAAAQAARATPKSGPVGRSRAPAPRGRRPVPFAPMPPAVPFSGPDPWAGLRSPRESLPPERPSAAGGRAPALDAATLSFVELIRQGAKPGVNAVNRAINQSSNPAAAREAIGLATGDQIRRSAEREQSAGVTGIDMDHAPASVQNSTRWQTGY